VYHIHTRSVFSVKGVNKRFSDFKELDALLRKQFTFLRPLPAGEPAAALSPWRPVRPCGTAAAGVPSVNGLRGLSNADVMCGRPPNQNGARCWGRPGIKAPGLGLAFHRQRAQLILLASAPGPGGSPRGADKMFGNKDPDFIEERKTQLQQWLDDAVANPEARGGRHAERATWRTIGRPRPRGGAVPVKLNQRRV
jgi:hypothetical protein